MSQPDGMPRPNEVRPLWLAFDFNYSPTVCIVSQKIDKPRSAGGGCFFYAEHSVEGGTERLCKDLKRYKKRKGSIYVAGDFSGNTRHTSAQNTDYDIISKELGLPQNFFKETDVPNKDHVYSRDLCNYFFKHVHVRISARGCPLLIEDLEIAQCDDKGKLKKDRETFCMDLADAFRYQIDAWFPGGISDIDDYVRLLNAKAA